MDMLDEILSGKTEISTRVVEKGGATYYDDGINPIRIDTFVKEGRLVVDEVQWAYLNENFQKQKIVQALSSAIEHFNLKIPFSETSLEQATDDFIRLQRYDSDSLLQRGECEGRVNSDKYPIGDRFLKNEKIGRASSNYFHQKNRLRCGYHNFPSPQKAWSHASHREVFLRALWSLKYKKVDDLELRSTMTLRGYVASQFPPAVAKFFYDKFKAERVLDFSSGWGDRLAGFYASNAVEYLGLDPNPELQENYKKQIEFYSSFCPNKKAQVIKTPAEDFDYSPYKGYFDLVFTSPPYFDRERYVEEPDQSWMRYPNLKDWLDLFLLKTLRNCWESLKPNGYLIVNIADIKVRKKNRWEFIDICEPMNDEISGFKDAKFLGCVNLKLANRPMKETKTQVEPVWIWRKIENK